jgi:hypothetical protein
MIDTHKLIEFCYEAKLNIQPNPMLMSDELLDFAQMIVKECTGIMRQKSVDAQRNNTYMGDDVPTSVLISAVEKHFRISK